MKKRRKSILLMLIFLFMINVISINYAVANGDKEEVQRDVVEELKEQIKKDGMVTIYMHKHKCSLLEGEHVSCRTYPYWLRCCRNQCGTLTIGK